MTLYDVIKEAMESDAAVSGVFLAKPTGKLLDEDKTFVQLEFQSKLVYAKMMMPHGWFFVPTEKWLQKHKDEFLFLIAFEAGNPSHPVVLGMLPVDDKEPGGGYPNQAVFKTEEFEITVNDKEKTLTIKSDFDNGETQEVRLEQGKIVVQSGSGGSVTLDSTGVTINEGSDVAVLGNQLVTFLNALVDQVALITTTNAAGPSGPPNNVAAIQALKAQINVILSQKLKIL